VSAKRASVLRRWVRRRAESLALPLCDLADLYDSLPDSRLFGRSSSGSGTPTRSNRVGPTGVQLCAAARRPVLSQWEGHPSLRIL
jgi:hypothetical protein